MPYKKLLVILIYISVGWMIVGFVFGNSGILYNIKQSQRIIDLSERVWKSRIEIEEMTREYAELVEMKTPSQAFLIDQGRKTEDLLVFKIKDPITTPQKNKKILQVLEEDKKSFIYAGIFAALFLLVGWIAIPHIVKNRKTLESGDSDDRL
ncbi:MAG: hypothetical protein ACRCS8_04740 [Brevinema sp.]